MSAPVDEVRTRLQAALRDALRARDRVAASALRGAMSALDGAEVVPADGHEPSIGTLEDVDRKRLEVPDIVRALTAEVDEHERAASLFRDRGDDATADEMVTRARTVARFLPATDEAR